MPVSAAHKRATQKWESKAYDKLLLRLRKDESPNADDIKAAADAAGESVNGYIKKAIDQRIERESQ